MPDGLFCVSANINDHNTEARRLTHKDTYAKIRAWVMAAYGQKVTNLDVLRAKQRCGLQTTEYKGKQASGKYDAPHQRQEKEEMVIVALHHFGLV